MPSEAAPAPAAAYYNSPDITDFYRLCWGGADIHIGLYRDGATSVAEASAAMTDHLLDAADLPRGAEVLDISCGYGGTLRTLARRGFQPSGMDIAEVCVAEARAANAAEGFTDIPVNLGDFHAIDSPENRWDAVICQESIIHSPTRERVFAEVYRVLKPDGVFAFSDILTAAGADIALVDAAFERLGANSGATVADYQTMAEAAGFELSHVEERADDIRVHYDRLVEALANRPKGLSPEARDRIGASLGHWRRALAGGHITWACFVARKPG